MLNVDAGGLGASGHIRDFSAGSGLQLEDCKSVYRAKRHPLLVWSIMGMPDMGILITLAVRNVDRELARIGRIRRIRVGALDGLPRAGRLAALRGRASFSPGRQPRPRVA
jgi:hypothetical protein